MAISQMSQELYRVHDTMAETTTVVQTENKEVMARNYMAGYQKQVLDEMRKWITLELVGYVTQSGYVEAVKNQQVYKLDELLNNYSGIY